MVTIFCKNSYSDALFYNTNSWITDSGIDRLLDYSYFK